MGTKRFLIASILAGAMAIPSMAQDEIFDEENVSNFGVWTSLGVEKKITKRWGVELEGELRTADALNEVARYSVGISTDYKICSWLKADMGYILIAEPQEKSIEFEFKEAVPINEDDLDEGIEYTKYEYKIEPAYTRIRHRANVSLTANVKLGRFKLSLRERWQYTYRPEKNIDKIEYDIRYLNLMEWFQDEYLWQVESFDPEVKNKTIKSKHSNVLRSRLQVEYDIKGVPFEPYASVEVYNDLEGFNFKKMRYTIGGDYKINKQHSIGMYYRYQDFFGAEKDESSHILGIGYKFKF